MLRTKENNNGKYNLSRVYKLQCADCPGKYIGQMGRTFRISFKEHVRDIKNNGQNSIFSQHILDTKPEYKTMEKKQ
jgi:hypothetical protein